MDTAVQTNIYPFSLEISLKDSYLRALHRHYADNHNHYYNLPLTTYTFLFSLFKLLVTIHNLKFRLTPTRNEEPIN